MPVEQDNAVRKKMFYYDLIHPDGHTGHRVMGEFAAQLILDAFVSLERQSLSAHEVGFLAKPMLDPMLPNNYAAAVDKCFVGPQLVNSVVNSDGWQWVDEGKSGSTKYTKFGYVGTEAGKRMQIRVNTTSPSGVQDQTLTVQVCMLKSYENMGKASVTCEGGCTCEPTVVDAHHTEQQLSAVPCIRTGVSAPGMPHHSHHSARDKFGQPQIQAVWRDGVR